MIEYYEQRITKKEVTIVGQERYGTSMHAREDLTHEDFLTEAVIKYAERSTQAEERMAHI